MIKFECFEYSDAEWNSIKVVVRDALGRDADQIEREITPAIGQHSITGIQPLRSRIEIAAGQYRLHSAVNRRSSRRAALQALRQNAADLRDSILCVVAVPFGIKYDPAPQPLLLDGVDADMLTATRDYFRKLLRNLDRMIEQSGSSRHNARKPDRDRCWRELLAVWCDIGGEPSGKSAAQFIRAASKPVMGSAVPSLASIVQWLERHQNGTADTVKPVRHRATR